MIVIPSVVGITSDQETVLKEYVQTGGITFVFDPQELSFPSVEGPYPYGNGTFYFMREKKPALYYQTYDDSYRASMAETIQTYVDEVLHID